MSLRKHQYEFLKICQNIGSVKKIVCHVTPGGGKSALPVIAAKELIPMLAQRICWIVPRVALQEQAESAFTDPHFRRVLNHKNLIRVSTNEKDPSRGLQGFATTYASVVLASDHLAKEFGNKRYILVLDEPHHISEKGSYKKAIEPLIKLASLVVFMSGTLERGSKDRIAFLDYAQGTETDEISIRETEETKHINYTRLDALDEKAVIPLRVTYLDTFAEWKQDEIITKVGSLKDDEKPGKIRKALFTALSTQFAEQLLDKAVADWQKTKQKNPRSKMLVVAGTQALAKKYAEYLHGRYRIECGVATVNEGKGAMKAIRKFKRVARNTSDNLDVISTVGMAYEGLDVKPITHIACLTRIRSKPWIEQMLARATRYDPEAGPWIEQDAHVFAPDDPDMHSVIDNIVKEQMTRVNKKSSTPSGGGDLGPTNFIQPSLFGGFQPLNSGASVSRSIQIDKKAEALPDSHEVILTPSQIEDELRKTIDTKVKSFSARNNMKPQEVNGRIKAKFGKPRSDMTLDELKILRKWADQNL